VVAVAPTRTDIWFRPGYHWLILGQTQSGKSVFATDLARGVDVGTLVIVDPKSDPDALVPNCAVARSADDVLRHLPGRVCWQPSRAELGNLAAGWDRICTRLLELAEGGYSSVVVVHELADLCSESRIGPAFRQLITQGAKIAGGSDLGGGHITGIFVSQRPRRIWYSAKTEARHVACFTLTNADDRAEAAAYMGDIDHPEWAKRYVAAFALPNDHSWWYASPEHRLTLHDPVALPH
jgi:hypothetical protein